MRTQITRPAAGIAMLVLTMGVAGCCGRPSAKSATTQPAPRDQTLALSETAFRLSVLFRSVPQPTTDPAWVTTSVPPYPGHVNVVSAVLRRVDHPMLRTPSIAGETPSATFDVDPGSTVPAHRRCGVIVVPYDEFGGLQNLDVGAAWKFEFEDAGNWVGLR